jgi:RHS repeat-associated protein
MKMKSNNLKTAVLFFGLLFWAASLVCAEDNWEDFRGGGSGGFIPLNDFERINLYNGRLIFQLPLLEVKGRGEVGYPLLLKIDKLWGIRGVTIKDGFDLQWVTHLVQNDSTHLLPYFTPAHLSGRVDLKYIGKRCPQSPNPYFESLTRLTFFLHDGSEFELRDELNEGKVLNTYEAHCQGGSPPNRGKVFRSYDGSGITFVSDAPLDDGYDNTLGNVNVYYPSGFVTLKNGVQYRIEYGRVAWMRDRNGNRVGIRYVPGEATFIDYQGNVTKLPDGKEDIEIKDSLGREVWIRTSLATRQDEPNLTYDILSVIEYTGVDGAKQKIRIGYDFPEGRWLRRDYPRPLTGEEAFPELDWSYIPWPGSLPAPNGPAYVEFPDGRKYRFFYNPYGELARVELPTGGAVEYDWAAGPFCYPSGVIFDPRKLIEWAYQKTGSIPQGFAGPGIYRRVAERRVYPDEGGVPSERTRYTKGYRSDGWEGNVVEVDHLDPVSGALLSREKHHYWGAPTISLLTQPADADQAPFWLGGRYSFYPSWMVGKEYMAEQLAGDGGTVLKRVENKWEQKAPVSWWTKIPENAPSNDPRITEITTTLADTSQVSRQVIGYDENNNRTEVFDYDFGPGAPGALLRHTRMQYVKNLNGVEYGKEPLLNLAGLLERVEFRDGEGREFSRTLYEYDNYTADENHAPLLERPGIAGLAPGFDKGKEARGNVTAEKKWLDTAGGYVTTYRQYDVAGNVVKSIDPNRNVSRTEYSSAYQFAYPTEVTSPVPEKNGSSSPLVTNHTYDFWTGRLASSRDANGQVTSFGYDPLGRKKKEVRPPGGGETTFEYGDTRGNIHVRALTQEGDGVVREEVARYDGMGRLWRVAKREEGFWILKDTQYDASGKAGKVSNPYAASDWSGGTNPSAAWTTIEYDALGREVFRTTPDGARVRWDHRGNETTVTDQAGKQQKRVANSLGQMSRVVEDPAGLGYVTEYTYDPSGNLRQVNQGGQRRYFMYDSLSRLIRARNVEQGTGGSLDKEDPVTGNRQWSVGYEYDGNGNLLKKTDPRGIEARYAYDGLNRNLTVNYSDGRTHGIERFYDGAPMGKGRSWYYLTTDPAKNNTPVAKATIEGYDGMGRVLSQSQQFWANDSWGRDYRVRQAYNLAGGVKSKEYPAGRAMGYAYDGGGQIVSVKGTLGGNPEGKLVEGIRYNPAGQVTRQRLETQTPTYQNRHYNLRGQLYDSRLGTEAGDEWTWNRGALRMYHTSDLAYGYGGSHDSGTHNNGNIYRVDHFVPLDGAGAGWAMAVDYYWYDPLNRILGIAETQIGSADPVEKLVFTQQYKYDRFGNRAIDGEKTTPGGVVNNKVFQTDAATNRLTAVEGTLEYDAAGNIIRDTASGPLMGRFRDLVTRMSPGERRYDGENRMTDAAGPKGISRYTYDAMGRRVKRITGGEELWYVYGIQGELLAEYKAQAGPEIPQREYGYRGGDLFLIAEGKDLKWVIPDHLGTPRMMVDQTGNLGGMIRHDYLPFGEEVGPGVGNRSAGSGYSIDSVAQKFTGKERDEESGLDWFGPGRYYSSILGRFTSPDPLNIPVLQRMDPKRFQRTIANPQSWNGYVYAHNNPLSKIDPDGFDPITIIVPGTFNDWDDWNSSLFKGWVKNTFGGDVVVVKWDGWDNKLMRSWVGKQMAAAINDYAKKHPGEEINLVCHSHGCNVAFKALENLNPGVKLNVLVSLGVPVRDDYKPKEEKIQQHINVYSNQDAVQPNGGRIKFDPGMILGVSLLEFGPAGRTFNDSRVQNLDASDWAKGHSELWMKPGTWWNVVVPALKK